MDIRDSDSGRDYHVDVGCALVFERCNWFWERLGMISPSAGLEIRFQCYLCEQWCVEMPFPWESVFDPMVYIALCHDCFDKKIEVLTQNATSAQQAMAMVKGILSGLKDKMEVHGIESLRAKDREIQMVNEVPGGPDPA